MKTALVFGVAGQDGAYLAEYLLNKGYQVIGTSRCLGTKNNLTTLGINKEVKLLKLDITNKIEVADVLHKFSPAEIYNLAGVTSVAESFNDPYETHRSIFLSTLNILELMRTTKSTARFYNAGSGEMYGDISRYATECDAFTPLSPYAAAKVAAFNIVKNYRSAYGLLCCTGIAFNHESPLRGQQFVTQKIIRTALNIASGQQLKLTLGNLDISRDWGWAPDYIEAIWKMQQQDSPKDLILATGVSTTLKQFLEITFTMLKLNWKIFVDSSPNLYRPTDITFSGGNPSKAKSTLSWSPRHDIYKVIDKLIHRKLH